MVNQDLKKINMAQPTTLDAMILRAIPRDLKCANQEQYNKTRREWLKNQFEAYLADQLSKQFNARSVTPEPFLIKDQY